MFTARVRLTILQKAGMLFACGKGCRGNLIEQIAADDGVNVVVVEVALAYHSVNGVFKHFSFRTFEGVLPEFVILQGKIEKMAVPAVVFLGTYYCVTVQNKAVFQADCALFVVLQLKFLRKSAL